MGSLAHPIENAYKLRRQVAESLIESKRADCYGKGIEEIPGKRETLEEYMFSIAMENADSPDYFSEKLIDCLLLETIPVYFGSERITDFFDGRGILQFRTFEECQRIVTSLSDAMYWKMLPFARENKRKAIRYRWHNHAGLFDRLIQKLPKSTIAAKPIVYKTPRYLGKFQRKLRQYASVFRKEGGNAL